MKNIGQMMKQAQAMQANLKKAQEEIRQTEVVGSAGNAMVKVVLAGDRLVKSVTIDPALWGEHKADDKAMVEDLLMLAFNDASEKLEAISQSKMSAVTSGMPLPPGFKL